MDHVSVVGLDLSLTATGVATSGGTTLLKPRKLAGAERLSWFRSQLTRAIASPTTTVLVVLEGYSYGSKGRAVFDIGELGGVARLFLMDAGVWTAIVAPSVLKKFATGKGNADKDAVLAAAIRNGFDGSNNNEADAWWLRQMGVYHLWLDKGYKVYLAVPTTAYRDETVAKVEWPEMSA